jgi:hypothetical protein
MRTASFRVITQRVAVIPYRRFGTTYQSYRGADKSLARPTSRCILFHGENISFDASLVIYLNSSNIPPIMIINRIYKLKGSGERRYGRGDRNADHVTPLYPLKLELTSPTGGGPSVGIVRPRTVTPQSLYIN